MVRYGNVAEWLAAIGTIGAFAIALWLLRKQGRDAISAQARLVSGWVDTMELGSGALAWRFVGHNGSTEPVYDVCAGWYDPVTHEKTRKPELIHGSHLWPPGGGVRTHGNLPPRTGAVPAIVVEFVDSGGRTWRRVGGSLKEIRPTERWMEPPAVAPGPPGD